MTVAEVATFPAVCGAPRIDLAQAMPHGSRPFGTGFRVVAGVLP